MVTLTGTFTRLDGGPATGTVRVTPSRSPIMDPDGKIVISGPQTFPLDKDGKLTVQIPASNDPDLGPAFTYSIDVNLTHASWKISKVWIPHGSVTVDLSEIGDYQPVPGVATRVVTIPADGADGQVLVWDGAGFTWDFPPEGPEGPPGEVTTAALTAALAGKVSGAGMTVRHDTTVGERLLLDHPGGSIMLNGDTGWRNISGLLINGWTGDGLFIRRTGNRVELHARHSSTGPLTGATATSNTFIPWITGFRASPPASYGWLGYLGSSTGTSPIQRAGAGGISASRTSGSLTGIVMWTTDDPWPATYPGTPL